MKYIDYVVNPSRADLDAWQIHKAKGVTFIHPKTASDNNKIEHSILFHNAGKEKILIISPNNLALHGQELDVLFKYMKLPKETQHIDCLIGIYFPRGEFAWARLNKPDPNSVLHDVSDKRYILELTAKEKAITKNIEKIFKKVFCEKNNYKDKRIRLLKKSTSKKKRKPFRVLK